MECPALGHVRDDEAAGDAAVAHQKRAESNGNCDDSDVERLRNIRCKSAQLVSGREEGVAESTPPPPSGRMSG